MLKNTKRGLWLLNPTLTIRYAKLEISLFTILTIINNIELILY
jgi:hypothetical protein